MLRRMNRRYTLEYYLEIVEKVRQEVPGVSITTDIMVGFPGGETMIWPTPSPWWSKSD